jgi:O-antigen ligase
MEVAVAFHLAAFVVGVSWAFGGNADWVRTPISIWGSVGILLTVASVAASRSRDGKFPGAVRWAWPVLALNAIILASCLTPGFRQLNYPGGSFMMPLRVPWWIPSTARTALALHALWLFDGIYFSCLNAALVFAHRSTIRVVLAVVVANAVVLSVFGTVQKLVGATGIYFGLVKAPHEDFFASFVYDNHWGAFIVLMASACIGLVLRYASGSSGRGFFHGPALMGLVAAALLAMSVPYSGSRACTMILGILACVAGLRGTAVVSRALRVSGVAPSGAYIGMAVAAILTIACVWMVAGDVIQARASKTRDQVAAMWAQGGLGSRSTLYKDTLRMAKDRIVFGWGMGSYPSVFSLYNSQESKIDHLPVIYHDAHSDWLQSVAEIGLAGTALIGGSVLLPMLATRRLRVTFLPYFLLTGCILTAAYAWVEFPFGNVAVVLAWWLSYFSAVQYIRLTGPPGPGAPAD